MAEEHDQNQQNQQQSGKIHVDADWKAQARAEKERLAREFDKETPKKTQHAEPSGAEQGAQGKAAGAGGAAPEQQGQEQGVPQELPEASFETLVQSIASQALMALGAVPDPVSGRRMLHMPLAKFHTDTLGVLEEKTKGSLTDEEAQLIEQVLYELRMLYVQRAQSMQGGAQGQGPVAGPGQQPDIGPAGGGQG